MKLRNIVVGAVMALTIGVGVTQVDAAPIHDAAYRGDVAAVLQELKNGVDVNAKNEYGNTALIVAAVNGHKYSVKQLIEANADLNIQNNNGNTALILAGMFGRTDIAKQLIEANADVNAQDTCEDTALIRAAYYCRTDLARELLTCPDINIGIEDYEGKTALDIAKERNHTAIVKLIEDYQQDQISNYKTPW